MSVTVSGIVKNGVVVPSAPLPEGALVEIHQNDEASDVPPELKGELVAWQQASAESLSLVEKLAEEGQSDEAR